MDKSVRPIIFKRGIISLAVMWLAIFGCAGRLDYWPGWVFFMLSLMGMAISSRLYADMPDLVRERIKPGPGRESVGSYHSGGFYRVVYNRGRAGCFGRRPVQMVRVIALVG